MRKELRVSLKVIPPNYLRLQPDISGNILIYEDQFPTISMLVSKCKTRDEALSLIKLGHGNFDTHHNFKEIVPTKEQLAGTSTHKSLTNRK